MPQLAAAVTGCGGGCLPGHGAVPAAWMDTHSPDDAVRGQPELPAGQPAGIVSSWLLHGQGQAAAPPGPGRLPRGGSCCPGHSSPVRSLSGRHRGIFRRRIPAASAAGGIFRDGSGMVRLDSAHDPVLPDGGLALSASLRPRGAFSLPDIGGQAAALCRAGCLRASGALRPFPAGDVCGGGDEGAAFSGFPSLYGGGAGPAEPGLRRLPGSAFLRRRLPDERPGLRGGVLRL